MDFRHLVLEQDLDAHLARGLGQGPHESGTAGRIGDLVGPRHDIEPGAGAIEPIRSRTVRVPFDPVLLQPIEQVEIVVRIGAHQRPVAEPAHGLLGARPVGEHLIGRILHPDRLLHPIAAPDIETPEAHHGAPADVEILLDDQHRGALLARRDGRDQPAGARPDDHDIHLMVPGDPIRRLGGLARQHGGGGRTGRCARPQEAAAVDRSPGTIFGVSLGSGSLG